MFLFGEFQNQPSKLYIVHCLMIRNSTLITEIMSTFLFPNFSIDSPHNPVHIKIADYGISRISLPTGTKGFGGTEGFMAPEIICHNGEEEYTEKVSLTSKRRAAAAAIPFPRMIQYRFNLLG